MEQRLDETHALWLEFRKSGDQRLRDRLILTYAPLVKYVAGRLGSGLPAHIDEGDLRRVSHPHDERPVERRRRLRRLAGRLAAACARS